MAITLGTSAQLGSATLGAGGASVLSSTAVLNNLCDILENQGGPDGLGGFLDDWQEIATDVACGVVLLPPDTEKVEGEKITSVWKYEFTMPDTTVIDPSNRIRFAGYVFILQGRAIAIPTQATIKVRARLVE